MTKCVVCKQEITDYAIETDKGPVHAGECFNHIQELPVTESTDESLNEVELLL